MAVHAGNWAGRYKGMKPSLKPMEDMHSVKREFFSLLFALYQSAISPGEKTIQTDLKKKMWGILAYAPTPGVSLIEGLPLVLLIDG